MTEFKMEENNAGGYTVRNIGDVPVGKPHKSQKGKGKNDVFQGGKWLRAKTNGDKSEHLYRINISITDCGVAKD